ncbi:Gfo/Idh/MocA family oxidoreductase [Streptomyces sp. NPDC046759]|uniref:Gfo/Idh/MocA family protein n=1 Tax=Streptomyces sp. NPDC046759 TaxID=3155019 RepID=UPI003409C1EE
MSVPSTPRVAVVGCGRRFHTAILPVLQECGALLVGVVDPDSSSRERVPQHLGPGAVVVSSGQLTVSFLRRTLPDIVIICSPSGLHFQQAKMCLEEGLPTFLEKPLACRADEAVLLRSLSAGRLATSEQRVHRPDLLAARDVIRSGRLGRLLAIEYRDWVAPAPAFRSSWRNRPLLAGGGVLLDLGYHTINTLQWLLDSNFADLVPSAVRFRYESYAVESQALIRCVTEHVALHLDVGLDATNPREELCVTGTQGRLRLRRRRGSHGVSIVEVTAARGEATETVHHLGKGYDTRSLKEFMNGKESVASLERHVATVETLEKLYREEKEMEHFR